jgi:tetratricopeptide (TPR) repeat protein
MTTEQNKILNLKKIRELTGFENKFRDMLFAIHNDEKPELSFHGSYMQYMISAIAAERACGRYSKNPYDFFLVEDQRIVVINDEGIWGGKGSPDRINSRFCKFLQSLPIIDRQETNPVRAMIDSSVRSEIIHSYLEGEDIESRFIIDKAEIKKFNSMTPEEAAEYLGKYTSPIDMDFRLYFIEGEMYYKDWQVKAEHIKKHLDEIIPKMEEIQQPIKDLYKLLTLEKVLSEGQINSLEIILTRTNIIHEYHTHGMFEKALMHLEELGKENRFTEYLVEGGLYPDETTALAVYYNNLGYTLLTLNKPYEAINIIKKGLELGVFPSMHNNFATALQVAEKYSEAEEEYKKELEVNPSHITAKRSINRVKLLQGVI